MKLVDSHCHLFFDEIYQKLDEKLRLAKLADVRYLLSVSTDLGTIEKNLEISSKYKGICCSVGVHPLHSEDDNSDGDHIASVMLGFIEHDKVVAIGEVGLDYHYDDAPSKSKQITVFEEMLSFSRDVDLPYIFHARECFPDIFDIISRSNVKSGVFHCYTGSIEDAKRIIDKGFYISFSGVITFSKSHELREIAKYVPADRVLIETDCPYLTPVPYRGKPNEPAYVSLVAECLAKTREVSVEEIAEITTTNFFNLFPKARFLLEESDEK
ncbi:MAG: TatD family hydrolase [Holosporales bacterium]|jgi:TatD DNase family protein|nr:TatD family hydrolase [Holosporales bacterium]